MRVLLIEDDRGWVRRCATRSRTAATPSTGSGGSTKPVTTSAWRPTTSSCSTSCFPTARGLDFLKAARARGDTTPVIILTALDQISDRIAGLNAGADDYLVKPFDLHELTARLAAVSRRYHGNPNPLVTVGALAIDLAARSVRKDGRTIR